MASTFSVLVGSDSAVSKYFVDSDPAVSVHKLHFLIFSSLQDNSDW